MKYKIFYSFLGGSKGLNKDEKNIKNITTQITNLDLVPESEQIPKQESISSGTSTSFNTTFSVNQTNNEGQESILSSTFNSSNPTSSGRNDLLENSNEDLDYQYKIIMVNNIKKIFEKVYLNLSTNSNLNPFIEHILTVNTKIDIDYYQGLGTGLKLNTGIEKHLPTLFDFNVNFYIKHIQKIHKNDNLFKYLDFYNTEQYRNTHNLTAYNYLFPIIGLLNHKDNPNCFLIFNVDNDPSIGTAILIPFRDIEENEQLTINYSSSFSEFYEKLFSLPQTATKLAKFESVKEELQLLLNDGIQNYPFISYKDLIDLFDYLIQMNESVEQTIAKIKSYNNDFYEFQSLNLLNTIMVKNQEKIENLNKLPIATRNDFLNKIINKFLKIKQVFEHEQMSELKKFLITVGNMFKKETHFKINIKKVIENIKSLDEDFLNELN